MPALGNQREPTALNGLQKGGLCFLHGGLPANQQQTAAQLGADVRNGVVSVLSDGVGTKCNMVWHGKFPPVFVNLQNRGKLPPDGRGCPPLRPRQDCRQNPYTAVYCRDGRAMASGLRKNQKNAVYGMAGMGGFGRCGAPDAAVWPSGRLNERYYTTSPLKRQMVFWARAWPQKQ